MTIPKTMKALVAYSADKYRYEPAYPVPECGDDDILIKTEGCGICAGDLKCQDGAAMFWGDGDVQPAWVEPPFIPGHEFIGIIAYVGKNVKGRNFETLSYYPSSNTSKVKIHFLASSNRP
mgnify:CR=1 FL=1|jgi:L-iditol 2-dehydrogenase